MRPSLSLLSALTRCLPLQLAVLPYLSLLLPLRLWLGRCCMRQALRRLQRLRMSQRHHARRRLRESNLPLLLIRSLPPHWHLHRLLRRPPRRIRFHPSQAALLA